MPTVPHTDLPQLEKFLSPFLYEEILIGGVLDGKYGEVRVDRWPEPRVVMVEASSTIFLAGDPEAPAAQGFVEALEGHSGRIIFDRVAWEAHARRIFGRRLWSTQWTALDGSSLSLDEVLALKETVPEGIEVRRMSAHDAQSLAAVGAAWRPPRRT